jgi:hypothetical protein
MKLIDDKFTRKSKVSAVSAPGAASIRAAMHATAGYEVLFDRLAQVGGPNMVQDEASPLDVLDVHKDAWPESDIRKQTEELRTQGMEDQAIVQYLMQIGVLGRSNPRPEDVEYLSQMVRSAQKEVDDKKVLDQWIDSDPAPEEKPIGPDLSKDLPQEQKDATIISFLQYVKKLHDKWSIVWNRLNRYNNPRYVQTKQGPRTNPADMAPKAEKQSLMRELKYLSGQISKAGSIWKLLRKTYGPEVMQNEEVKWLQEQLATGTRYPKSTDPEDLGDVPKPPPEPEDPDKKTKPRKHKPTPMEQFDKKKLEEKPRTVDDILADPTYNKHSQVDEPVDEHYFKKLSS